MKANYLKYILFSALLLFPFSLLHANNTPIGINEANLAKIPTGIINLDLLDADQDGLDDELEKSLGTNYQKTDSDSDSFSDKTEIENNYNPLGKNKITIDIKLAQRLVGQYLLRVEKRGELWYVNPKDSKRYLVGNNIRSKLLFEKLNPVNATKPTIESINALNDLASAIRSNSKTTVLSLVDSSYQGRVKYTMDNLTAEQKFIWANMLSSATLKSETTTIKVYSTEVYFGLGGKNVTVTFEATKQPDGKWLISKL